MCEQIGVEKWEKLSRKLAKLFLVCYTIFYRIPLQNGGKI